MPPIFRESLKPSPTAPTTTRSPRRVTNVDGSIPELPRDLLDQCLSRRNGDDAARGRLTRWRCGPIVLYFSSDYYAFYITTTVTLFIVLFSLLVLWRELSSSELTCVVVFLLTAFLSSWLVTCTDPGVYPRLQPNEPDPLQDEQYLTWCRICAMRRPPRAAHCYSCNVCVLEHDHHCNIIGGCVGMRSLRWFTLYLVCIAVLEVMAVWWLLRHLMQNFRNIDFGAPKQTKAPIHAGTTTVAPQNSAHPLTRHPAHHAEIGEAMTDIGAVFMLIINLVVLLLVGCFAGMYVYLLLTSTTRRESNRACPPLSKLLNPVDVCRRVFRTLSPPPSMLHETHKHFTTEEVTVENLL